MKKALPFILIAAVALLVTSCFTILDAVLQTEEVDAAIVCIASSSYSIDVTVDSNQYHVKTVKQQDLDRKRNLKHLSDNMVYASPGYHNITVRKNGRRVYDERVYLSSDETKLIHL